MDISQYDEHLYKRRRIIIFNDLVPNVVSMEPPKSKAKYGKGVPKSQSNGDIDRYEKELLEYLDTNRDTSMNF